MLNVENKLFKKSFKPFFCPYWWSGWWFWLKNMNYIAKSCMKIRYFIISWMWKQFHEIKFTLNICVHLPTNLLRLRSVRWIRTTTTIITHEPTCTRRPANYCVRYMCIYLYSIKQHFYNNDIKWISVDTNNLIENYYAYNFSKCMYFILEWVKLKLKQLTDLYKRFRVKKPTPLYRMLFCKGLCYVCVWVWSKILF